MLIWKVLENYQIYTTKIPKKSRVKSIEKVMENFEKRTRKVLRK